MAGDVRKAGLSDEALVERVRDRDGAAFDTLFGRYFVRVHGFVARRVENPAEVEAAVEDIFVQMLAALDAFRGEKPFSVWLLSLTKRALEPDAAGAPPSEHEARAASLLARARRLLLER
jgi:hypothetical protein